MLELHYPMIQFLIIYNITQSPHSIEERPRAYSVFSEFIAVTGDQPMKLIGKISRKSCDLDPIPASLTLRAKALRSSSR